MTFKELVLKELKSDIKFLGWISGIYLFCIPWSKSELEFALWVFCFLTCYWALWGVIKLYRITKETE